MNKNRVLRDGQCCAKCKSFTDEGGKYRGCYYLSQVRTADSGTLCKYFQERQILGKKSTSRSRKRLTPAGK